MLRSPLRQIFHLVVGCGVVGATTIAWAQPSPTDGSTIVTCASGGERVECAADTSAGVALQRSTGSARCVLGMSWGYDAGRVWVKDGCAGEFVLGSAASAQTATAVPEKTTEIETWGAATPGKGFLIGRTAIGELSISAYALFRYLNQMPSGQTFQDHLGRTREVDARHDIWAHRFLVHFKGWLGLRKLIYQITFWTVNTTDQDSLLGVVGYQFHRKFSMYVGMNGIPGSRSMHGSHPYWLGHDRVMADEFFRPYFTHGAWVSGEVLPGLWYQAMVGNTLSNLGVTAAQLSRNHSYGGSVWWMPTTHEFGPNGSFDDWEFHEAVATRFGASGTYSREDRFSNDPSSIPDNTTLKLADSVNVFDNGALAPDVTLQRARYRLLSADAGLKYRGIFLQAHYFHRWLDEFVADGPLPIDSIVDKGFYLQAAFYPVKKKLQLYGVTSWVFGDDDAGFDTQYEYVVGANWFVAPTRDIRLNGQLTWVDRSPVSSSFGYYVGGQKGTIASLAASIAF